MRLAIARSWHWIARSSWRRAWKRVPRSKCTFANPGAAAIAAS